jgi:hypothetical protein
MNHYKRKIPAKALAVEQQRTQIAISSLIKCKIWGLVNITIAELQVYKMS